MCLFVEIQTRNNNNKIKCAQNNFYEKSNCFNYVDVRELKFFGIMLKANQRMILKY